MDVFSSFRPGWEGLYRISYEFKINLTIADQRMRSPYVSWEQSYRDILPLEKILSLFQFFSFQV